MTEFYGRIAELERSHATFAVATVVARRSPVSSHLGDRAVVFADGRMEGFVGGSCSRDTVRREALRAMRDGAPRLLRIRPQIEDSLDDLSTSGELIVVPMGCASEGAVDIYIEPHVTACRLIVIGCTPVADALVRLASIVKYDVARFVEQSELNDAGELPGARTLLVGKLEQYLDALEPNDRDRTAAVVASQGHYDEIALERLLARDLPFVGLLASRRRAANIASVLAERGAGEERLARVRTPVGLDIGARSPGEVAISILAQIVAEARVAVAPGDEPTHCCSHSS